MIVPSKTCFVISPIGPAGSAVRQLADDLYDLIIGPSLEKYHFQVLRADKIPRPSPITAEIIQLVHDAQLCVVDLTGHNPNVFYEAGRRHETGKPFIQVIKKGEAIPFDLAGIRTIEYDMTSARTVRDAVLEIQRYVDEMEQAGYPSGAGVSLSSLASALDRIERDIRGIGRGSSAGLGVPLGQTDLTLAALRNPREAFTNAMMVGDLATAAHLLPRLELILGLTVPFGRSAALLATTGLEDAALAVLKVMAQYRGRLADMTSDDLQSLAGGLGGYYAVTDREKEGIPVLEPIVREAVSLDRATDDEKAFLLNQLGRLYHGAGLIEQAVETGTEVLRLQPDDPSYLYNQALNLRAAGKAADALPLLVRLVSLPAADDEDHFMVAAEAFAQAGMADAARTAFARLQSLSIGKANYVAATSDELRAVLADH